MMGDCPADAGFHVDRVRRGGIERLLHGARCVEEGERAVYSETATPDDRALEPISSSRESAIVVIMPFSERAPAESASESNAANKGLADSSAHECAPAGTSTIPFSFSSAATHGSERVVRTRAANKAAVHLVEGDWG